MNAVYVARQPIFTRDLHLFGYELLFRPTAQAQCSSVTDDDQATQQVITTAFTMIGLERLVGYAPALINVGEAFLLREAEQRSLPSSRIILEVLESVTATPEVLGALETLRGAGYRICLDDFEPGPDNRALLEHADIVKLETEGRSASQIAAQVDQVKRPGIRLLAEKLEDRQQFRDCLDIGFHYFQGYFLSRPRTVRGAAVPAGRLATLRLLATIQRPDLEVAELERIITTDVGLSYRLLRYMNSAYYQLQRPLESVRQAILYLGLRELRRWASLMAISTVDNKPPELIRLLTVRARMCELIGARLQTGSGDAFFTVGLFSGLDAVLDAPLDEALAELPLSDEVHRAVLHRSGRLGEALECVLHYEAGDWDWLEDSGYASGVVIQCYLDAIDWARQLLDETAKGMGSE
ncbi:MAG: HDOD domain-containing protein [Ectothiorhodospiraceae bacterium]